VPTAAAAAAAAAPLSDNYTHGTLSFVRLFAE
jgi:hypothetical protein